MPRPTLTHLIHSDAYHQGDSWTCTLRTRPSHRVPELTLINCKLCHAGRCYKHILSTYNIHSSGALLARLADGTSKTWHSLHQARRDAYTENYAWIKEMIWTGSPAPLADRLVYFASNFSATPVNRALSAGFYDAAEVVSFSDLFRSSQADTSCPKDKPAGLLDSNAPSTSAVSKGKQPERRPSWRHFLDRQKDSENSTSRKRSLSPQAGASNTRKHPRLSLVETRGQKASEGDKGAMTSLVPDVG